MSTTNLVIWGIVLFAGIALFGYVFMIYNGLVALKENIRKSWANIDVLLKQRFDEIPKLISVCEGYVEFKKGVLDRFMQARENYFRAGDIRKKADASIEVSSALKSLFAFVENYPDLKANKNFLQLQNRISKLEESIADRREFYNDSTNNYNIRNQQIPDVFIANFLNYRKEDLFKAKEEERKDVEINIQIPQFNRTLLLDRSLR